MLRHVIIALTAGLVLLGPGGCSGPTNSDSQGEEIAALKDALAEARKALDEEKSAVAKARKALAREKKAHAADLAVAEELAQKWGDMKGQTDAAESSLRHMKQQIAEYKVMLAAEQKANRETMALANEKIDRLKAALVKAQKATADK